MKIGLYQLRRCPKNMSKRFAGLSTLKKYGYEPKSKDYELVYMDDLDFVRAFPIDSLERIWDNINRSEQPSNYYGYTMSIGDIVVLSKGDDEPFNEEPGDCYFVDNIGFKKLENFFDENDADHAKEKYLSRMDIKKEADALKNIEIRPEWMKNDEAYIFVRKRVMMEYAMAFSLAEKRKLKK